VFIAPKSYAIKYKNTTVVKIKGFEQNSINFEEIKTKFYKNDQYIETFNNFQISKKNFILEKKTIKKIFNLQYYDKRKFCKNKKNTSPFTLNEKGEYA
jgi:hypothetical protein